MEKILTLYIIYIIYAGFKKTENIIYSLWSDENI